jgi:methionyl aminopeptidase
MRRHVSPGMTTAALDEIATAFARASGARSAPRMTYDFPGFTCISVNEEIVHGIPGPRVIRAGDVVKLDVTLELDGFMADSAVTVLVPPATAEAQRLHRAARVAFQRGLAAARIGRSLRVVGAAIERAARCEGAAVLRELAGHGIGRRLHEDPEVPNWGDPLATTELREGMVFALEPMLTSVPTRVVKARDGWTLRTHNHAIAVHYEHTIMVRRGEALVLTAA